ncbi:MAG: glycerophosphodiester phosphodiesterase [Microthrixaceae bacterium]|nr:glycerophosphodiester phosphodiesterase [Microthrixaceae bacterium]
MTTRPASHGFLVHDAPLAFAHRGGTEKAPENSLAAFAAAVEVGFTYLETDVHLTADGVVVAAHDERLDRVSDANGEIAALTWREVSQARLAGREPIPTFEELLVSFPDQRFNIDPKSDAVVGPLMDALVRLDAVDRVCVGAFSQSRLKRARDRLGPALCTSAGPRETVHAMALARISPGASVRRAERGPSIRLDYGCLQIPLRHKGVRVLTAGLLEWAHNADVQVHVWTVDDPTEMHRLLDMGVDGIMTDRPSILRKVLDERANSQHRRGGLA